MSDTSIQKKRDITIGNKSNHELINDRLINTNDYKLKEPGEVSTTYDKYSPKGVVGFLRKREFRGQVSFFFNNKSVFVTLDSNGQLNTKDGEEGLFKAWGTSEFKHLSPKAVFEELEDRVTKIDLNSALGNKDYSFNSYNEFISCIENPISKH